MVSGIQAATLDDPLAHGEHDQPSDRAESTSRHESPMPHPWGWAQVATLAKAASAWGMPCMEGSPRNFRNHANMNKLADGKCTAATSFSSFCQAWLNFSLDPTGDHPLQLFATLSLICIVRMNRGAGIRFILQTSDLHDQHE